MTGFELKTKYAELRKITISVKLLVNDTYMSPLQDEKIERQDDTQHINHEMERCHRDLSNCAYQTFWCLAPIQCEANQFNSY